MWSVATKSAAMKSPLAGFASLRETSCFYNMPIGIVDES
jgi:hypothetical protein